MQLIAAIAVCISLLLSYSIYLLLQNEETTKQIVIILASQELLLSEIYLSNLDEMMSWFTENYHLPNCADFNPLNCSFCHYKVNKDISDSVC